MSVLDEVPSESASREVTLTSREVGQRTPMPLANGRFWPLSLIKSSLVSRTGQNLSGDEQHNNVNSSTYEVP